MSASEDDGDVARVLAGDVDAFEGIVRRWQGPLVNLAYRFCRDRGRAEEMAQDAFVRAFRSLSSWRRDSTFSTWLFAVALNVYRSELRRIPMPTVPLDVIAEPGREDASAGARDRADQDRVVRRIVSTLPARYRDAMVLFYFHEMDVAAAARTLRLPEGTLKARLSRARNIVRRKLGGVWP